MGSKDINNVIVNGRLTRDPEVRAIGVDNSVCKIGLAVNEKVKRGGEWIDEVSFFDIVIWGKQGEAVARYTTKGSRISVSGRLQQNKWEQDGRKMSRVEIVAHDVQFLDNKPQEQQPPQQSTRQPPYQRNIQAPQQNTSQHSQQSGYGGYGPENFGDDIPF